MWKMFLNFIAKEFIRAGLGILVHVHDKDLAAFVMDSRDVEISVYSLRQFMALEYKKCISPPDKLDYGFMANNYRHNFAEEEVQTLTSRIVCNQPL